jgi:peroxiredoxin
MGTAALWVVVGLLSVVVGALGIIILHLVSQHGRLLLRVEALESPGHVPHIESQQPPTPSGRPVGAQVEPFELPTARGGTRSLQDFSGRNVLLVHWHPSCGYCREIAPELAQLEAKLHEHDTELVLLSYGTAEENCALADEHALRAPILLQEQGRSIPVFEGLGTPVAYLLDKEGRIAAPLAFGSLDVPELAHAAAAGRRRLSTERPLAESRILRTGLPAGTPAPAFSLPALDGRELSLSDYRGRRLLLVFSDPDCEPCNQLAPRLSEFERAHGDEVAVVMVTRGGVDENRRKIREHGIDFPVVVQPGRRLSREYGIFATPVAFLIDEDGVIARDVAEGTDAIQAVAAEATAREEAPMT